MVMGGKLGEGIVGEFGMGRNKLLYLKWVTNKNLTVQHKGLCSMLCGSLDERGEWERMDTYIYIYVCMYMAESLCCPPETITTV